jgi:hypothetical protein
MERCLFVKVMPLLVISTTLINALYESTIQSQNGTSIWKTDDTDVSTGDNDSSNNDDDDDDDDNDGDLIDRRFVARQK